MDMGTGKTITTIALVGGLLEKGLIRRLLVVCPKSIVGVWKGEFAKFADYPYTLTTLDGTMAKKKTTFEKIQDAGFQVVVVNYESCWRLAKEITEWAPDMIVCDESSKIKTPEATQSKCLHNLGKLSKYNVILTGTPVTNNPLDFFSQYKFLDESILGDSYFKFKNRYAIFGGYRNHNIIGYNHLSELVEKVHSIAYRIKVSDAVELPSFIDETREVELEPKAQSLYRNIERDCYAELMSGNAIVVRNILTQFLKLSQCTGGYIRDNDEKRTPIHVSTAKLEALEDIVDSCMDEDKKVVVFARFVPEIQAIENMLQKKKIGYSLIYGATQDRAKQVEKVQTDPNVKVFIGQLQTVGMGLTLTAASVAVFYSLDFSYENYEQSRARIHRIGQKEKCVYIHLVCKETIDERVLSVLQRKGSVASLLVDEWRDLLNGNEKKD